MKRNLKNEDQDAVARAVRVLRRMIFDGTLAADQPLRQDELASKLGMSRQPLREALGRLSGEGLVTFRARRGYVVTALAPEEITEIFDMRAVLEEHAGYRATCVRTSADVDRVGETLLKMKPLRSVSVKGIALWSDLNREFHSRFFGASRQRHLCRIIGTLLDSVETYIRLSVADAGLNKLWLAHEELFEAFRDGDALLVARLSRRHVGHSAESLLMRLRDAADGRKAETGGEIKPHVAEMGRRQASFSTADLRLDPE